MNKKLYVGGLPYSMTEDQLREAFSPFGSVASVKLITDKFTGRARGFGFVEMTTEEEAQKAIEGMGGKEMEGRALTVNEARPEEKRSFGGGGGGRGGYGGGGYGEGGGYGGRGGRGGGHGDRGHRSRGGGQGGNGSDGGGGNRW